MIYRDDIEFLKKRLKQDKSWIDETMRDGLPLDVAADLGRFEICKWLLENGADPDGFKSGHGLPIILSALDNPPIVKLLIKHGANLRKRITWNGGRSGWWPIGDEATALHYAVQEGNLESVKLLVEAGMDPNAMDTYYQTPIHLALYAERTRILNRNRTADFVKVIRYLLDNDASTKLQDRLGRNVIKAAEACDSPKEIREMLEQEQLKRFYSKD